MEEAKKELMEDVQNAEAAEDVGLVRNRPTEKRRR